MGISGEVLRRASLNPGDFQHLPFGVVAKLIKFGIDLFLRPWNIAAPALAGPDLLHQLPEWVVSRGLDQRLNRYQHTSLGHSDFVIQLKGPVGLDCSLEGDLALMIASARQSDYSPIDST